VWGAAQRGIPPQINVIGTIMFALALVSMAVGEMAAARGTRRAHPGSGVPSVSRPALGQRRSRG